ncbi:MAG: hypothetical protein SYR96_27395 [Actinomycetota bacterium]|nr:hypothetical protein [Actinomycetota bacterium]
MRQRLDPSAGLELVRLIEQDVSPDAAIAESQRQVDASQDPGLRL